MEIIKQLFDILKTNNLTISCCESASGGALSNLLTSVDGSSQYFKGSIISYSNSAKINVVKVPEFIINERGAISKETAEYMAKNTNRLFLSDVCISITGNASQNNLQENKESCFYYVGITIIDKTYTYELNLEKNERNFNRLKIATEAVLLLINLLQECIK